MTQKDDLFLIVQMDLSRVLKRLVKHWLELVF